MWDDSPQTSSVCVVTVNKQVGCVVTVHKPVVCVMTQGSTVTVVRLSGTTKPRNRKGKTTCVRRVKLYFRWFLVTKNYRKYVFRRMISRCFGALRDDNSIVV